MGWLTALKGIGSILWDLVKWCVLHPFHVGCIVFALAAWHYRGKVIDVQASANTTIAALQSQVAAEKGRADTEAANAAAAEKTNAGLNRQLDLAVDVAKRNLDLRRAADAQAQAALREVQTLRQTTARLKAEAAAARSVIYANDPEARAWAAVPVPAAIADRLRAEARGSPPG